MFYEFLRRGFQGLYREKDEAVPFLFRALVRNVDVDGGRLENPDGSGTVTNVIGKKKFVSPARVGPKNPPNSIKARILTNGLDKFSTDDNLRVFWPFFPDSVSFPIKPGEHVYVIFEDAEQKHGLWISKVAGHVGVNYSPGEDHYVSSDSGNLSSKFDDTRGVANDPKKFDRDEDAAETRSGDKLSSMFPDTAGR